MAVIGLLAALIGAILGTSGTLWLVRSTPGVAPEARAPIVQPEGGDQVSVVSAVAEAVIPSVVRVDRLPVAGLGRVAESGLGGGVIYRSDGYIITNHHVIAGGEELSVKYASGESFAPPDVGLRGWTLGSVPIRENNRGISQVFLASTPRAEG